MATRKFIELEEAAKMLGVSPDTVTEMRDRGKIHGYRDGASWKFKPEEIERAIAERESAEEEGEFAEVDEDPDSILLSEVELGQSDESTSSTIIGGKSSRNPADSDIQLAAPKSDSSIDLDSALTLEPSTGSDVLGSDIVGGSGIGSALESGSGAGSGSGVSPMFDELDTLDLDLPTAADSGISSKIFTDMAAESGSGASKTVMGSGAPAAGGSGMGLASEDELALGEDEQAGGDGDDDLLLTPDAGGSAIDLAEDVDDDLVLGGSSHGDISRTGDSGISLLDPADSGLSLESQPLELGGSAVESLDLGGDDDMLLTEDEAAEPEAGEVVADEQSDDDFLLTPLEEASAEESDSGSQVIALDDDVEFEDAGGGMEGDLGGGFEDAGGGAGLLEDDLGEDLGGGLGSAAALAPAPAAGGGIAAAAASAAAVPAPAAAPEAPFSGWNVASLGLCAVLLLFCGVFAFDLLRNMWSWNEAYSLNSSMMDMVLSWFEG